MSRRPLVAGAALLVAVVIGVGVFFAASVATVGSRHTAALAALESARRHNNAVHAMLTDPALNAALDNAKSVQDAKAAMDDYRAKMGGAIRIVESQLAGLKAEQADLQGADRNPLTFSGRSQLSHDRERVDAATAAFDSAAKFLTISDGHLRVFNATLAGVVELDNVIAFIDANDISGGLALIPQLKQQLQSAATVAQGAPTPPQLKALIAALTKAVDDLNQALAALQSNDRATLARLAPTLDADGRAVSASFDAQGLAAFELQLLGPYRMRYEANMKKAGFELTK